MLVIRNFLILLIAGLLTACVHIPSGPSVMTLPGSGKSFDQFRSDEYECRQYAYEQVGGNTPRQASRASGVESAVIGAGLGAAAGAAIGGGHGAAIGAGTGLLMGGLWLDQVPHQRQDMPVSNATILAIFNACTPRGIVSRSMAELLMIHRVIEV